jgi:tetratricopeptide (TPR) repeat protein
VVGKEFWPGPVAQLEGVDSSRLDQTLDRLRERGLILSRLSSSIAGEREFMFKHVLTRDVAYESIPRRDRAVAHARVASWIEGQAGDRSREFAELLAHHYGEAHAAARLDPHVNPGESERLRRHAFDYALRASEESRRKLASDQAIRLARAALEVAVQPLERARALEALGEACVNESRGDEAWDALREAVDLRLEGGDEDPPAVARLAARALEIPTRMPGFMRVHPRDAEALAYLRAGLSHAGAGDTEELARLLIVQAFWPYSFVEGDAGEERIREAREAGERAAAMALRLERPALASAALDAVATSYISRGNYGGVRAVMERRLDLASRLDDPWELGDIHASAAWAAIMAGRYREALELAGRGYDLVRLGPPAIALYCLDWRAVARFHLGQWDGFFDDVAASEELMTGRDDPPLHALQHIAVAAYLHEVRGEPERADACVDLLAAHGRDEGSMGPFWEPWLARLHARRGAYDEAERRLALAEGERADRAELGLVLESRCDLVGDRGSWDEAPRLLADARSHAAEGGLQALLAHAGRLEGRAALTRGELSEGVGLLRDSSAAFADLEARWETAVTDLLLAEGLASAGRPAEASSLAEAASQVFDQLGARDERERCRDLTGA